MISRRYSERIRHRLRGTSPNIEGPVRSLVLMVALADF
jgi:hypothetical protein